MGRILGVEHCRNPMRSRPHLLRLRRRRLGEASGVVGATAEVGGLGAGLNHFAGGVKVSFCRGHVC